MKVKGYSGKFTPQRGLDPNEGLFSKPYKNPVAAKVSNAGNSVVFHLSEATLSVRRKLGIGRSSSPQVSPPTESVNTGTYPLTSRSAGCRRSVVIPNSFEVMREGGTSAVVTGEAGNRIITGSHLTDTRPVTDNYGQVILRAILDAPPRSKTKAGMLIGGMLTLGGVGVAGWKHEVDGQAARAALENAEENLSDIAELKKTDDSDLHTIMLQYLGGEDLSADDIQEIIVFMNKIRTTATDTELQQFFSGTLPERFSEDIPNVL